MAEDPDSKRARVDEPSSSLAAYDEDNDDVYRPAPRKPKNLSKRASLPTFESSIDRFITDAKAEPHKHDVSYFEADSREGSLAKEIDELKKKLAEAEAKAEAAAAAEAKAKAKLDERERAEVAVEPPAPKRGWGGILAGVAIGAGVMFGVTRLVKPSPPTVEAVATQPQPPPPPKPEPAVAAAPVDPSPVEPKVDAPKVDVPTVEPPSKVVNTAARPTRPAVRPTKPDARPDRPAETKPAETKPPADPGLYNPF